MKQTKADVTWDCSAPRQVHTDPSPLHPRAWGRITRLWWTCQVPPVTSGEGKQKLGKQMLVWADTCWRIAAPPAPTAEHCAPLAAVQRYRALQVHCAAPAISETPSVCESQCAGSCVGNNHGYKVCQVTQFDEKHDTGGIKGEQMRRVPEAEQHSGFTLPSSALTGVYTCLSSVWWLLAPSICMRTKTAQVEHHSGQVRQMQLFLESHHLSRANSRTKGPSGRWKLGKLLLDSAAPSTFSQLTAMKSMRSLG